MSKIKYSLENNIKLTKKKSVKIQRELSIRLQNIKNFNNKIKKQKITKKSKLHKLINNYYVTHIYKDHAKYVNGIDIIYWINLDRSIDRRQNMEKVLNNFKIKNIRIKANDGKLETDEAIYGKFITDKFSMTKLEYACLLSHLNTIKQFSESNNKIALIFEDDISLEFSVYWNKSISQIIKEAPKDWDIIMLGYSFCDIKNLKTYTKNTDKNSIFSTMSYIINKKSALKFINNIYKNDKYILTTKYKHQADNFLYRMNTTFVYKYSYFTYLNNNISTIEISKIDGFLYPKIKALLQWKTNILDKIMINSKNILTLNNNNNTIMNEKQIIENSYGFYCQFYYKNKIKHQIKNYIILKINSLNIYIYSEYEFTTHKNYYIETIITYNKLIKQLEQNKELKFILDYIKNK